MQAKHYEYAIFKFKKALKLNPEHANAIISLGECYYQLSKEDPYTRKEYLQKALQCSKQIYQIESNILHSPTFSIAISNRIVANALLIQVDINPKLQEEYLKDIEELLEKHQDLFNKIEKAKKIHLEKLIQEAEDFIAQQNSPSS